MSQTQTTTDIAPTLTLSGLDDITRDAPPALQGPSCSRQKTSTTSNNRPKSVNNVANSNSDNEPTTCPAGGAVSGQSDAAPADPRVPGPDGQGLSGTAAALIMTPLCLSVVLSSLDLTIVTPAIPAIVSSFASPAGYIWIGGAFILANTAITPVWGSVADIWGRKPVMLAALAIFLAGSLLCAVAPDMNALVAGRAIQGLGAAGMSTMVNVIICDSFSLRDRGLYLAITSIVWAVGTSVGPVLGGLFTTRLHWRWCFWINLPIGALVFVVLFFYLKVPSPNTPVLAGIKAIDWPGSVLIIGGALMVLLGLDFGDVTFPWSSATVICLIVFGTAAMGIFFINEWKFAPNPIIPLRLFSTVSSSATYAVFALNFFVFIGLTYYLPLYSQAVLAADALTSGVYLLPLIVSSSISAACTGVFIQRTGVYLPLMYVSQAISVLGVGLFISLDSGRNLTKLFIFEVLAGVGAGMNIEPPLLAAQAATTVKDTAAVVALMGFLRALLTAVSVVIGGVLFQNSMNAANEGLVEKLGAALGKQFAGDMAPASVELIASLPENEQIHVRGVYFEALKTVWIMYVAFAGLSALLNLFVRAHHLRTETEAAVLGLEREKREGTGQPPSVLSQQNAVQLQDVRVPIRPE